MRAFRIIAFFTFACCATPILAEPPPDLRRVFPKRSTLTFAAGNSQLARWEIPAEILGQCRPDLSDLRLFDAQGQEIAFLIDRGMAPQTRAVVQRSMTVKPLRAEQSREVKDHLVYTREVYELPAPPRDSRAPAWEFVCTTDRTHFVRRLDVDVLAADRVQRVHENGSLFRLPRANGEQLTIALPPGLEHGLRITLTGQDTSYVEPRFRFVAVEELGQRRPVLVPLPELNRDHIAQQTVLELARPSGVVPNTLHLTTSTAAFDRTVIVEDIGPGARVAEIGRGSLFRLSADTVVEHVEIPIAAAHGERLRVRIDDGDSPALAALSFSGLIERPVLIFAVPPPTGTTPPAQVFFGGGRAHRPRYDLAGLLPGAAQGERAEIVANLQDANQLRPASNGDIRDNPVYDRSPALAFAMHPGAPVDQRLYAHRRTLRIEPSTDGLSRIRLDPADLALLRPDLGDLRVVDSASQQWPYLLEQTAPDASLALIVKPVQRQGRHSRYELALPVSPLPVTKITLVVADPYFDRPFQLIGQTVKGEERVLAQARLVRQTTERSLHPLEVPIPKERVQQLVLLIEDGDNASLGITEVTASLPMPQLFLAAPAGDYALLLGHPEDHPPAYDIARVRDLVLAVNANDATIGALAENAVFHRGARLVTDQGAQHLLLWLGLGLAVLVLGVLVLRLARRENEPD